MTNNAVPTRQEIMWELARRHLIDFAEVMLPGFERTPFHEAYYRILEAFARGVIQRLIVTVPPQHGKSLGSSEILPAYILGLNPDLRVAIGSYGGRLARKFNQRVQRHMTGKEYPMIFPETRLKGSIINNQDDTYSRTTEEFDIVGHKGGLQAVGRGGPLTGNRVDVMILDDLYKDAMEGNSAIVRDAVVEWYNAVVRTRQHNTSRELIVFTRWHEDDLIGYIEKKERVMALTKWEELDSIAPGAWVKVNFPAIKEDTPTEIDPRKIGTALWPERHSLEKLLTDRKRDPVGFSALYQGNPFDAAGALYGTDWNLYDVIPTTYGNHNYTDLADTGTDRTLSVSYRVGETVVMEGVTAKRIYVTDIVFTDSDMNEAEVLIPMLLERTQTRRCVIESNNGGRYFATKVAQRAPYCHVVPFTQTQNKEARILTNAPTVKMCIYLPRDWASRWPQLYAEAVGFKRIFKANAHDEVADVFTAIIEQEIVRGSVGVRRIN